MREEAAMVVWRVVYARQACKDAVKLARAGLRGNAEVLLKVVEGNPYQNPPPYERLSGDLAGLCSRRINIKHRLVYEVCKEQHTVKVLRMWTHYE